MPDALEDARAALEAFAGSQGDPGVTADSLTALAYAVPLLDVPQGIRDHGGLVATGADLTFEFTLDDDAVRVAPAAREGEWRVAAGADRLRARLDRQDNPRPWRTEHLTDAIAAGAAATGGTARMTWDKTGWREALSAATGGRAAWVGPSARGFAAWVEDDREGAIDELLGAAGGAIVSVADGPAKFDARARLVIAAPGAAPPAVPSDPALTARLPEAGHEAALKRWHASLVRVTGVPAADARRIELTVAWAAATAVAEVREDGILRPSRTETREWRAEQRDANGAVASEAILDLAEWVAADYGETRLNVARFVAAEKIENPFAARPAADVRAAADVAYQVAISADVRVAMEKQRELEKSYLEAEKDLAALRESITEQADQVVIRTLTAALAVAIAALTAREVRGWPVTIAAAVLAIYLGIVAWYTFGPVRDDARNRLKALDDVARGRADLEAAGIKQLGDQIAGWRTRILGRARTLGCVLTVLAVVAVLGGWLGNEHISPLFSDTGEAGKAASSLKIP